MSIRKTIRFVILCMLLFTTIDTPSTVFALGTPSITSISPGSPSPVGTSVEICAKVVWDSDFRSMRIRFGNEGWQEQSSPEFCRGFGTGHLSPGWYTIRVEVARQGDNSWSSPTVAEASYQLTQAAPPPQPSCSIQSLNVTPGSGTVGTQFSISGSGSCDTGVRAIRFKIDGGIIYELGAPSATTTWNSSGTWTGTHTATVEVAGWGDNSWSYAASQSAQFIVSAAGSPPPPPPDSPPPVNVPPPPPPQPSSTCSVDSFNVSPTSGSTGTVFTLSGNGSCNTGVRAIRFKIDGGIIYELGASSANTSWNSSGTWEGTHTATVEVAGWGDDNWSSAASWSIYFNVGSSAPSSIPIPDPLAGIPFVGSSSQPDGVWVRVVASQGMFVRSGPGTNHEQIGRANNGVYFEYIETDSSTGWHHVRWNGGEGWVSDCCVEVFGTPEFDLPQQNEIWKTDHPADIVNLTPFCGGPFKGSAWVQFSIEGNFVFDGIHLVSRSSLGNGLTANSALYKDWQENGSHVFQMSVECTYLIPLFLLPNGELILPILMNTDNWELHYREQ